jgi:hypothetical protein
MKKKLFRLFMFLAFFSCTASNKTHWQKVHPHGAYAGKHYLPGDPKQVQYLPKHK